MDAHTHLLTTLSSHGSSLGPDDMSWAFTNPKTVGPVSEWVERRLRPETLLSVEEAELYEHLRKTGALKQLLQTHDPGVPPRSESSLRAETDSLRAATEQLQKQTSILRSQKASLEAVRSRQRAEAERRKKLEAARRKKYAAEKEELAAGIEDLLTVMKEEAADLKATVRDPAATKEEVTKILESDDRVLGRLEGLAKSIVVPDEGGDEEGAETVRRVEELVKKLSELQTQVMQTKLDRIFLEAYTDNKTPAEAEGMEDTQSQPTEGEPEDMAAVESQTTELQAEIESLYSEIPMVASMVLGSRYLRPVQHTLADSRRQRGENWEVGGDYIRDVLRHLQKRTEATSALLEDSLSRDHTILSILASIDAESASSLAPAPLPLTQDSRAATTQEGRPCTPPSPAKRGAESPAKRGGESPTKTLGRIPFLTPARRRTTKGDLGSQETCPELTMLSHLGVPYSSSSAQTPGVFSSPSKFGSPALAPASRPPVPESVLQKHVRTQQSKLAAQMAATDAAVRGLMREAGAEAWAVRKTLLEGVYSQNLYPPSRREAEEGAMVFVGAEVREGVKEVEKAVDEVAGKVERCVRKVEELERFGGDAGRGGAKRAFVERWSR